MERFLQYLLCLYQSIPQRIYWLLLIVLCFGSVLAIIQGNAKKKSKIFPLILLCEYVFLLLLLTVCYRAERTDYKHELSPFGSYFTIFECNNIELLAENIMNVIVFLPIGVLIGFAFSCVMWWKTMWVGLLVSISIEAMQFFFNRGFAETDDVIHNTIGCLMGFFMARTILKVL